MYPNWFSAGYFIDQSPKFARIVFDRGKSVLEESKFCRCKLSSDQRSYRDVGSNQVVLIKWFIDSQRNLSLCQIRWRIEELTQGRDGFRR